MSDSTTTTTTTPATTATRKVKTCLWFESGVLCEEAARFYTALFESYNVTTDNDENPSSQSTTKNNNSHVDAVIRSGGGEGENSTVRAVELTLCGVPYIFLNGGGAYYKLSPAVSISVATINQEETDRLWDALISNGGEESRCGWLVDRWGVSWQIIPDTLVRGLMHHDPTIASRVQMAMMTMTKIDIAAIEAAMLGEGTTIEVDVVASNDGNGDDDTTTKAATDYGADATLAE